MENLIKMIIYYLIDNRERLSRNKFTGVHHIKNYLGTDEDVYRVHVSDILPRSVIMDSSAIASVVKKMPGVEWDSMSLWLTIYE